MAEGRPRRYNTQTSQTAEDDNCKTVLETPCVRTSLPENLVAHYKKENLIRDIVSPNCDGSLLESVMSNYIIAKKILKHVSWQDKLVCKLVCSTWKAAIQSLKKEQLQPEDFIFDTYNSSKNGLELLQSGTLTNEPLVVFVFVNTTGIAVSAKCKNFFASPCNPPCDKQHSLIEVIYQRLVAPANKMNIIKSDYMAYLPLSRSSTYPLKVHRGVFERPQPIMAGIYIPALPNVEFKAINIEMCCDKQKKFYSVIDELCKTRIIKGVLVFVTEKYLLENNDNIVFLNYFKKVQPDIPYAFGGCIIEDAMSDRSDIEQLVDQINASYDYITENVFSIGLFTIPKDDSQDTNSFDMFSLVIDSSEWTKVKIEEAMNEFARSVPRFEFSVMLMLSCVGRDCKHEKEQEICRRLFPDTRIIGCYGNGELGINHPFRKPSTQTERHMKRFEDRGPQYGFLYSYSTVFVYIGWGRKYPPQDILSTTLPKRLRKK